MAGLLAGKPKVLIISGTTAVGKTDISIPLARRLNGEIISADSAQVFKCMNIGSAKVEQDITREIPHHLIDVVHIGEKFTAGDFREKANMAIKCIQSRGKLPIVVGGTGFYIHSLLEGPSGAPVSTTEGQARAEERLKDKTWEESVLMLSKLDEEYASKLSVNDWYRMRRALEICLISGRSVSSFKKSLSLEDLPYTCKCLFLSMPRVELYQRIDRRSEQIVENGLFEEVVNLVKRNGLQLESQSGRCIGYRQALEFLQDIFGFPTNVQKSVDLDPNSDILRKQFVDFLYHYQAETRKLAHDQLTWFRKEEHFTWLNMSPNGTPLDRNVVSDAVARWVEQDTPLPEEFSGKHLKELTKEENKKLKHYCSELHHFSNQEHVSKKLRDILFCIKKE